MIYLENHRLASFFLKGNNMTMTQESFKKNQNLRKRLINLIKNEGVNQKHISKKTNIAESILSRFKNNKCELGLIDREALDDYLECKGY